MARSNAWRKPFVSIIDNLSHDGRGVTKVDGKVVFIPGALPGEEVEAQRVTRSKKHESAKLLNILTASADRIAPKCPSFNVCGGCSMQHLASEKQIEFKQIQLLESLERIAKVTPQNVITPLTSDVWGYRRRARLGVRFVLKKNKLLIGFREKFSNFLTDMKSCDILDSRVNNLLPELTVLISSLDIKHNVPQIEVAAGDHGFALVFRVLQKPSEKDLKAFHAFADKHPDAYIYLQSGGLDTVKAIREYPTLTYDLGDELALEFEPVDFVQVNAALNKLMIKRTLEYMKLDKEDKVLDLFCGLGNFTLPISRHCDSVVGVEGDTGLVARAAANAKRTGCGNVKFHVANLFEDFSGQAWSKEKYNTLLIDPPRTGAEKVVQTKKMFGVDRIVYISCHPGSLARDAGHLVHAQGFKLISAGVMDMFPHTSHVESIAVFER